MYCLLLQHIYNHLNLMIKSYHDQLTQRETPVRSTVNLGFKSREVPRPRWWNPMKTCKMKKWMALAVLEKVSLRVAFCLIRRHSKVLGFQQDKPQYSHYSWIQTQVHPKVSILSFVAWKDSQLCQKLPLWKKYNWNSLKYLFQTKFLKSYKLYICCHCFLPERITKSQVI